MRLQGSATLRLIVICKGLYNGIGAFIQHAFLRLGHDLVTVNIAFIRDCGICDVAGSHFRLGNPVMSSLGETLDRRLLAIPENNGCFALIIARSGAHLDLRQASNALQIVLTRRNRMGCIIVFLPQLNLEGEAHGLVRGARDLLLQGQALGNLVVVDDDLIQLVRVRYAGQRRARRVEQVLVEIAVIHRHGHDGIRFFTHDIYVCDMYSRIVIPAVHKVFTRSCR